MNHVANHRYHQAGFTIIELTLAMTFVSMLLLGIAMTVIQISTIYNRGLVLKEVNQAARDIDSDLHKTIPSAQALNLPSDYVVTANGGRLCFGNYSYIWNTKQAIEAGDPTILTKYDDGRVVQFVKVPDSSKIYCTKQTDGSLTYSTIRAADTQQSQELLSKGEHNLALTQFRLPTASSVTDPTTGEVLYTLTYTIGAGSLSAMDAAGTACLGPGEAGSDLVYCNVQTFTLVLRVGNRVS